MIVTGKKWAHCSLLPWASKIESPENKIIVGSFLALEGSQKTVANNSVQFLVVKRTAQKKKVETITQVDSKDIRK